jgi:hypothetical protein
MKKSLLTGAAMLFAVAAFSADANLNDAKIWEHPKASNPEAGILEIKGPGQLRAKAARFQIDPNAIYRISGEVRKAPGANTKTFLAGYVLYDKDQKEIQTVHIRVINGTRTTLAEDAKAGATTLKVKNAVRWLKTNASVAFNAGPLPNRELADYSTVVKEGTAWIVTLKKPLAKDYKAGTKVWVQSPGAHFSITYVTQPNDEWQKFQAVTKGVGINKVENGKFWPGTAYAEPMLMPNWYWGKGSQDQKVQIRNLKVEKVSK